jgi:hypothetical protein
LFVFLFGLASAGGTASASGGETRADRGAPVTRQQFRQTQITVQRKIIVRVPMRRDGLPIKWVEKNSRKCVEVDEIAGANLSSPEGIDLILRNGERWRMKFKEECPGLGFYQGFYLRPDTDRHICAKRDVIHPRSGGECEIQSMRRLQAEIDD